MIIFANIVFATSFLSSAPVDKSFARLIRKLSIWQQLLYYQFYVIPLGFTCPLKVTLLLTLLILSFIDVASAELADSLNQRTFADL